MAVSACWQRLIIIQIDGPNKVKPVANTSGVTYIKSDKAQMVTKLENYFTTWDKEQKIWQVAVTELGRSIKVDQSDIRKFIHVGDVAR
jgi:hypothetical protein